MLIELPVVWILILNVAGWLVIQLAMAWIFTRMPVNWFNPGPERRWEEGGRFYERIFAIKQWKDRLPDAAGCFPGGFAKKTMNSSEPEYLARFIRETRRGELCHWLAMGCAPLFMIWNPWWGELIIIAYALAANLPCVIVQRYNKLRLGRLILARTARHSKSFRSLGHSR